MISPLREHPFRVEFSFEFCADCDGTRTAEFGRIGSGQFVHPEQPAQPVIRGQYGIATPMSPFARRALARELPAKEYAR